MQPPAETNYGIVIQNTTTPSANVAWNLGPKKLRYLNVRCDYLVYSNLVFHNNGMVVGHFPRSYNDLRDKPTTIGGCAPEYYETLSFFPDKHFSLTATLNNLIPGLVLEAPHFLILELIVSSLRTCKF
jgi:hypothetical protein